MAEGSVLTSLPERSAASALTPQGGLASTLVLRLEGLSAFKRV